MNLFKFSILSFENDQNHFSSDITNWILNMYQIYMYIWWLYYDHVYDSLKDVIIDIKCVLRVCIWFVANAEPLKETMDPYKSNLWIFILPEIVHNIVFIESLIMKYVCMCMFALNDLWATWSIDRYSLSLNLQ